MKVYNISNVIKKINDSNSEIVIIKYENMLFRKFCSPILFLGSILNFFTFYLILHQDIRITLINSLFLMGFSLFLELFYIIIINNERLKANIFTIILSSTFIFVVIRFYSIIGPTVWTISIVLIMLSMVRIEKSMLKIVSLIIFLLGMYIWYKSSYFYIGTFYYISQTISFLILFIISDFVYKINTNRYHQIKEQYQKLIKNNK